MKQISILFILAFVVATLLIGCATPKQTTQLVEHTTVDTIYMNQLQYDSIFISQDHFIDRSSDTIYIRDVSVQYKYKMLRDTSYIHRVDTIPVIKTVEVVKTERYVPWYAKALAWLGVILLLFLIIRIIIKIYFK